MERGGGGWRMAPGKKAVALIFFFCLALAASAEAPIGVVAPKKARSRIVEAARAYIGVPYLYGGSTRAGVDCSGLVWRVYIDVFGVAPLSAFPRTARDLFGFVEPIDARVLQPGDLVFFNTTGSLSHVGIYEGEGLFIQAASDGPHTGVIESLLSERYWSGHFVGAGRVIPPAEYLGIILTASIGPSFGANPAATIAANTEAGFGIRGVEASAEVSYRLGSFEAGLELRPSWDSGLSVLRLPLVLSLSIDRHLRCFAGPALTLGSPSAGGVVFSAEGDWLATAGLVYEPARLHAGGLDLAPYVALVYDRYVSRPNAGASVDSSAQFRMGAGVSLRFSF
jgi:probable lipoprotein NlpC